MGRPRLVSDDQILSTTRHQVLTHGPRVSLEVVAKELDVTVPAILKRFGNRQALMVAALKPPSAVWIDRLDAGPTEAPLEEQLAEIFAGMSAFLSEAIPCLTALRESGIPMEQYRDTKTPDRGLKSIAKWLRAAHDKRLITATDFDTAAYAILGAAQARIFVAHMSKAPLSPRAQRQYAAELASFIARALTTRSNAASPKAS